MANFVNKQGKYHNKGVSYSEGDDEFGNSSQLMTSDFQLNLGLYEGSNYNHAEGFTLPLNFAVSSEDVSGLSASLVSVAGDSTGAQAFVDIIQGDVQADQAYVDVIQEGNAAQGAVETSVVSNLLDKGVLLHA